MKKKIFSIIILSLILVPYLTPVSYCQDPYFQNINLQNIQHKESLDKYLLDIQQVRSNMNVINIQSNTPIENLKNENKAIDSYISQLCEIKSKLNTFINTYKDSPEDVYIADACIYIIESYVLSLREAKFLANGIMTDESYNENIFYSQQSTVMYYYLTVGDIPLNWFQSFFINK